MRCVSMSDLFTKLLALNFSIANDATIAHLAKAKSQATNPSFGEVETAFHAVLSAHAAELAIFQWRKCVKQPYCLVLDEGGCTFVGNYAVSVTTCNCRFHQAFSLPCSHMLNVRLVLGEPVADYHGVSARWRLGVVTRETTVGSCTITQGPSQTHSTLTLEQKHRIANSVFNDIAGDLALVSIKSPKSDYTLLAKYCLLFNS